MGKNKVLVLLRPVLWGADDAISANGLMQLVHIEVQLRPLLPGREIAIRSYPGEAAWQTAQALSRSLQVPNCRLADFTTTWLGSQVDVIKGLLTKTDLLVIVSSFPAPSPIVFRTKLVEEVLRTRLPNLALHEGEGWIVFADSGKWDRISQTVPEPVAA